MSLTVNKSIGKCFIHLAPWRVETGGLHSLISCWFLPSPWCCAWLGFALDPVWSCQCLWMRRGDSRAVPGIGDQVCCSAWTPQGAVSGLQSQCPGLHSTIRAVLPREPRGLSLSLPSWESFSSFPN